MLKGVRSGLTATAALAAVACGGTGASPAGLPLAAYVVHGHEETGYTVVAGPTDVRAAARFFAGEPGAPAQTRQLQLNGFRQAVVVHTGSLTGEGVSWVVQLASSAAARREQRVFVTSTAALMSSHGGSVSRFTLSGVPTATGLAGGPAANLIFVEGRCMIVIGAEGPTLGQARSAVSDATRRLYTRTGLRPGACA